MGRHSAPDEAGSDESRVVAVLDVSTLLSRHSGSTGAIRRVHAAEPVEDAEADEVAEEARPMPRPEPESAADQVGLDLIEDALAAVPAAAPTEAPTEPPVEAPPEAHTAQIPPIVDPEPAGPEAATPADAPASTAPATTGSRASSSDLALIRAHGDVRARCAAGLLVPFVLYIAVLLLIGRFTVTTFLLWIWIPLISAGVLIGLFLDSGHKRYGPPSGEAVTRSPDRP
jgi:hypothetical protein